MYISEIFIILPALYPLNKHSLLMPVQLLILIVNVSCVHMFILCNNFNAYVSLCVWQLLTCLHWIYYADTICVD